MTKTSNGFISAWMGSHHIVRAFIKGMVHDHHTAEDLLQATAIAANTHFESSYDPERPFTPWVIGIAKREIALHFRKSKRDRHVFNDEMLGLIAEAHAQIAQEVPDRIAALSECMKSLDERGRSLINMRYKQDMPPRQIAEQVGATGNAVSTLLTRLRSRLLRCIERRLQSWERQA